MVSVGSERRSVETTPLPGGNSGIDRQRRRRLRDAAGFALGELMVVIFVFGALATIVEFATSGVSSQAAVAVCRSDAATVESAIGSYNAETGGTPTVTALLLTTGASPYLKAFPSSPYFSISITSGVEMIAVPKNASPVAYVSANVCLGIASLAAARLATTSTVAAPSTTLAPTTTTISSP